jgi:hypothetical protein
MRHIELIILLLVLPATCLAAPWSHELPIGDGYSIVVSTTVSALCKHGRTVLDPSDYHTSRIDQYATTRDHVFVRAHTTSFILAKADDSVIGPLSESDFARHPVVLASASLEWKEPRNPHPYWLALLFLLVNPFFILPTAAVILLVLATLSTALRRRKHARPDALDSST